MSMLTNNCKVACNKNKKSDLQVIQNKVLRYCENKKTEDRITLEELHKNAKILSLEQCHAKQLLSLMNRMSKSANNQVIPN